MKILRLFISYLLISLLAFAFPVWGESDVVGTAVSSRSANLQNALLTAGSTVYSGDSIVVRDNGDASITLVGGDRLDIFGGSGVRVARDHSAIDFTLNQGSAAFQTVPHSSLQAVMGDATIRGLDGPSLGLIVMESPDAAIILAKQGKLSLRSEHDGNSLVLNEGQAARVTLLPPQTQAPPPLASATGPFLTGKRLAIITIIVAAGLLGGALADALTEHKLSEQQIINEITPAKP